ncbi:MAG: GAF domain-containing protein [Nitrospirae bacterium]|nr:GAF domain-containing protein [Nitrospirota bacterium]
MEKSLKALMVEDSEEDALLVARELRRSGYDLAYERVDTPDAFADALESGRWDVVLCDYTMPRFSGPAALELLHGKGLDIPFIIVSGSIGEVAAVACMKAGAHDYIMKDRLSRLAPAIDRELAEAAVRRGRRHAEAALVKLNRLYAFLRSVNQLIVRVADRKSLFDGVCRIAVDRGLFRMAWVGLLDEDGRSVRPAAYHGCEDSYLENINITVEDVLLGRGPTGTAVRTGTHCINNDTATNPAMAPWREAALARGYLSSAAFPLTDGEVIVGAFMVYSGEAGFFDDDEVSLLDELAGDLSFALLSIEQEKRRTHMEGVIKRGKEEWEQTFDAITDPIMLLDTDFRMTRVNRAMADKLGTTVKGAIGMTCYREVHGLDKPHPMCPHQLLLADGQPHSTEIYEERLGGYFLVSVSPLHDQEGRLIGSVHYARDITERKRAEEAVKAERERFNDVLETLPVYVGILTPDYRVSFANRVFREYFGESGGRHCYEFIFGRTKPCEMCETFKALETMSPHKWLWSGPDGRHYDVFDFPFTNSDGTISILEMGLDITEQMLAEEALKNEAAVSGALLEASKVAGGNLVWDEVAESMAGLLLRFTGAKGVFIFTLARDGMLIPKKAAGIPEENQTSFHAMRGRASDIGLFRMTISAKKTLRFDTDSLPMYIDAAYAGPLRLKEAVVTPIPVRDGVVGFILTNHDSLPDDPRVAEIIEGIARQLGVAHDNSRLYAETRNKGIELARSVETLKVLSEIDKKILSTLDRDEMMTGALSQIRRVAPADIAGVLLADDDAGVLRFAYGWCLGMNIGDTVPFAHCAGYQTLKAGKTLVRLDLADEPDPSVMDRFFLEGGIKSDIFVPIVCKDKGFGLLHVGSYRVAGFSPEDVETIENLARQMGIAIENTRLISDVEEMFIGVVTAMASAIDAKSPWTKGHSERVTNYAMMTAARMGLGQKDLDALRLGGLLHDIGKIGTYDEILNKAGKLTDEEFGLIRKHPDAGANILGPIKQFKDMIPIIRHHHERWDGRGYPVGLAGEDIPLLARILCVADSFDSMTADRPYRKSLGFEFAVEEIARCAGSQFDPEVARVFAEMLKKTG